MKVRTLFGQSENSVRLAAFVSMSFSGLAADRESAWWLRPKLGDAKVQRCTSDTMHADAPAAAASAAEPQDAKAHTEKCKSRFWVAPKGDVRRITPQGRKA